jgi:hypothetical protein
MPIPFWFVASFWGLALVVSILLGVYCREVHEIKSTELSGTRLVQQIWFNSIGALFGWAALWCLVRRAWHAAWLCSSSTGTATLSDFALGFVAFIGVSGYLPYATMGAVNYVLKRALELVTGAK